MKSKNFYLMFVLALAILPVGCNDPPRSGGYSGYHIYPEILIQSNDDNDQKW